MWNLRIAQCHVSEFLVTVGTNSAIFVALSKQKMNCVDVWVSIGMKSGVVSLMSSYMLQYILDNCWF